MNQEVRDQVNSFFAAWTSYTPTLGSAGPPPVLGNATLTGQYMKIGRTVHMSLTLTVGSTTTFGSSNLNFTLPATGASSAGGTALSASVSKAGNPNFVLGAIPLTNNAVNTSTIWFPPPSTPGEWHAWPPSPPGPLAAGDIVRVGGSYQAPSCPAPPRTPRADGR